MTHNHVLLKAPQMIDTPERRRFPSTLGVVSWNDAALINDSVSSEALRDAEQHGLRLGGFAARFRNALVSLLRTSPCSI